jgi:hypothetical protein
VIASCAYRASGFLKVRGDPQSGNSESDTFEFVVSVTGTEFAKSKSYKSPALFGVHHEQDSLAQRIGFLAVMYGVSLALDANLPDAQ